jgi:hypothetical protein
MAMSASDRRLKHDVVRVGEHPDGYGLYLFRYKQEFEAEFGRGRRFGVMADEVEALVPAAIHLRADGYKVVDYSLLGISTLTH